MTGQIVFRADASIDIGTGHVVRCLTLAHCLKEANIDSVFICRAHEGHLADQIREGGFTVYLLPRRSADIDISVFRPWLGSSVKEDAQETLAIISDNQIAVDWLIVDHYAINSDWEGILRPAVKHIMAIDDLADRNHDCDVLLDQNLHGDMASRYDGKLPQTCIPLLGPDYALLQPEYAIIRAKNLRSRQGAIRRILVFFGGSDLQGMTGLALDAIIALKDPEVAVDIVVGSTNPNIADLKKRIAGYEGMEMHTNLSSLAPLMAVADLAIGAGGATSWERLCLGLPSIVITTAKNQESIAKALSEAGLITWLGNSDIVTLSSLSEALANEFTNRTKPGWKDIDSSLVDGLGARRVRTILHIDLQTSLISRKVTTDDEGMLFNWANDPETRQNAFSKSQIDPVTHHNWLKKKLDHERECHFLIIETEDGIPVGQVRFDRESDGWIISYSVAREFRGRGVGQSLLKAGIASLRSLAPGDRLIGLVRPENIASRRIFEKLKFDITSEDKNQLVFARNL